MLSNRKLAVVVGLLAALGPAQAPAAVIVRGPWLQNVATDGITVVFEADAEETAVPVVELGRDTGYADGSRPAVHADVNGYHVYTATLTGLAADAIYHYRVHTGATITADATFKTAPDRGSSGFRFYAVGDNRTQPAVWEAVTDGVLADVREYPQHHQTFLLHAGDVVSSGSAYLSWDARPPAQALLARLPVYVSFGNHEDENTAASDAFLAGYFAFPFVAAGSTSEKWYSFDYGDLHVTAIDLYAAQGFTTGAQHDWLVSDLAAAASDASIDWRFGLLHFNPWSYGPHPESDATELQAVLHPLFRDHGVQCALGGHNHLYCRYAPVEGVTYVTTGGGGAPLHTGTYTPFAALGAQLLASAGAYHFCVIDVEAEAVAIRAIDLSGRRLDFVTFGTTSGNAPPLADAGPDRKGVVGAAVTLDGSASVDPEAASLSYSWSQVGGPLATLDGADSTSPSFTPTEVGEYLFELRVRDGSLTSPPDFVVARVGLGCAIAASATEVQLGETVTFDATASFADGGAVAAWAWDLDYDGVTFTALVSGARVRAGFLRSGSITVAVQAVDDNGDTCLASVELQVHAATADSGSSDAGPTVDGGDAGSAPQRTGRLVGGGCACSTTGVGGAAGLSGLAALILGRVGRSRRAAAKRSA